MTERIDVPYLDQSQAAPTGCESVSAVMLLNWLGVDISIREFIDRYLDKADFQTRGGILYGPDPREAFAGDPYDPEAMGCYAPVIQRALEKLIGRDYEVIDETGTDIDTLVRRYIAGEGTPVLLWATIDLKPFVPGPSWRLVRDGSEFTWRSNEHCMLLVGCDEEHYIFNDPWNNNGVVAYERALVRARHAEQYSQAVAIRRR